MHGPAQHDLSTDFVLELSDSCSQEDLPLLWGGDFNLIRSNKDRNRGSRRPAPDANFSCGLSLIIDAGQRTDWQRGGSLIQISAFYVIKRRRTFNIFLWAVYFQETFGSPSCRTSVLQHLLLNLLTNPLMIGGEKSTVLLVEIIDWV